MLAHVKVSAEDIPHDSKKQRKMQNSLRRLPACILYDSAPASHGSLGLLHDNARPCCYPSRLRVSQWQLCSI